MSHLTLVPFPFLEHLQGSNGLLISETTDLGTLQKAQRAHDVGRERVPDGKIPDPHSRADCEAPRNQSPKRRLLKGQETAAKAAGSVAEKLPSSSLLRDRAEAASLAQSVGQDGAGHEDWEVVSRHSSWGDVGLGGSLEASGVSPHQGTEQVSVRFQVHYTTSADVQFIAVTGDHESLGGWNAYVPLHHHKDGLWSQSVFLPAGTVVEWKFVLVENKEITRWEECSNRRLQTGHEDKVVHGWWGIP